MANEISTAGITVKYAVETTAGTRPTSGYTSIPNIKNIPEFNPQPSALDVTDLSDTTWKRYIAGLKDPGGALGFTANFTSAFKTAWATLVSAFATGQAASPALATWFEILVPGMAQSFYFAGMPQELGLPEAGVDQVLEGDAYIVPNQFHGWDTSST